MREVHPEIAPYTWSQRAVRGLGLAAAGLALGAPVALSHYENSAEMTEVAATNVTVSPTFDGYATAHNGLLPDLRFPVNAPLNGGVDLTLDEITIPSSDVAGQNLGNILKTYGTIASQPSGEIPQITSVIKAEAMEAAFRGGAFAISPTALYLLLGRRRRKELGETMGTNSRLALCLTAVSLILSSSAPMPHQEHDHSDTGWTLASNLFPILEKFPELQGLQIRDNAVSGLAREAINGAIETYENSKKFYEKIRDNVADIQPLLHQPAEGQTTAIVVSDRHDNIGMDPPHRALGDAVGAKMLVGAGDDTSSGKSWEEFSLRSLNEQFKGYTKIMITGNHDSGKFVITYWDEHGAYTSSGKVQKIDDMLVYLANDPRHSASNGDLVDGSLSFQDATQKVAETVCASDKPVALVVVHSASMGAEALSRGCVDLVIGGHDHVASPPKEVIGSNGHIGYTVTNGTSGGVETSFSPPISRLARDATDTLVTSENNKPVGVQIVTFKTNGEIAVGEYARLKGNESSDKKSALVAPDKTHSPVR